MPLNSIANQTIALAGLSQVCWLVNQQASTGQCDAEAMTASLNSLLKIDADSVSDVFGGLGGIRAGLLQLEKQLGRQVATNTQEIRYAGQLISLQKQLTKNPAMQSKIQAGIHRAQSQTEHFDILHENVLANFADLYYSTISTLQPRIMVIGDQQYLSSQYNINKIRSLLLAGIRSAQLWRQCGGRRWQLPLIRGKLHAQTRQFLAEL